LVNRSIKVTDETYEELINRMKARETFNDVIHRLLRDTDPKHAFPKFRVKDRGHAQP